MWTENLYQTQSHLFSGLVAYAGGFLHTKGGFSPEEAHKRQALLPYFYGTYCRPRQPPGDRMFYRNSLANGCTR